MKIFVLSDTHVQETEFTLESDILDDIAACDRIIHCGDFVTVEAYEALKKLKPIDGVLGNMDYGEIKRILPPKRVIEVEGVKIGAIHGWGSPLGLPKKVVKEFDDVDAVCFGHSHIAFNEKIGDVLAFNPGAFSGRIRKSSGSYGILEIAKGKITGIIKKRK